MSNREDNKLWMGLVKAQRAVIIVTAVIVTLIIAGACILRVFNINFIGFEELALLVVFWLYMIGCSHGSFEQSQITADILEQMLPASKGKRVLRLVRYILTFVLSAIFLCWAFDLVLWTAQADTRTSVFRIPVVVGQSSIFIGLLISTFYNLVYLVDEAKKFFGKEPKKMEGGNV